MNESKKWDAVAHDYGLSTERIFRNCAISSLNFLSKSNYENVLDLASGTGVVIVEILKKFPKCKKIIATDISPGMLIELEKTKLSNNEKAKKIVSTEVCSMTDISRFLTLDKKNGVFDLVTCQFGAEFLTDKQRLEQKFWEGISEVLNKDTNGECLVSAWNDKKFLELFMNSVKNVDGLSQEVMNMLPTGPPEIKTPDKWQIGIEMKNCKMFNIVKVEVIKVDFSASSVTNLWNSILGFSPKIQAILNTISNKELENAKEIFFKNISDKFLNKDGSVSIPCTFNLAYGQV